MVQLFISLFQTYRGCISIIVCMQRIACNMKSNRHLFFIKKPPLLRQRLSGKMFVGVTGFEPATTRPPPDVYSKTEYSTYFQLIILLSNVAVDFSVDLTVKG